MTRNTQAPQPLNTPSPSRRNVTKAWYHLDLFQKFALIFFAVVAVPVILIAIYTLQQSRLSLLESRDQFIETLRVSMHELTMQQRQKSEILLDSIHQQFIELNQNALAKMKKRLIEDKRQIYTASIESVIDESQDSLEKDLKQVNSEEVQVITELIEQYMTHSQQLAETVITHPLIRLQHYTEHGDELRKELFRSERFIHWSFFNRAGRRIAAFNKDLAIAQDFGAELTEVDSSTIADALSGKSHPVNLVHEQNRPWLRFFLPIAQEETVEGVAMGVIDVVPLWEKLDRLFPQGDKQIYILAPQDQVLYPYPQQVELPSGTRLRLESIERATQEQGSLRQDALLSAYTTSSILSWKIAIVHPTPLIRSRLAPVDEIVSQSIAQIEDEWERSTQTEMNQTIREMTTVVATTKAEAGRQLQMGYENFLKSTASHINEDVDLIAGKVHQTTMRKMGPIIIILGVLAIMLGILVAKAIIRPINSITAVAQNISEGNVGQTVPVIHTHDEIEVLSQSFHETTEYLRNIAQGAQRISEGEFSEDVTPVSEDDALGNAFQKMIHYLRDIATLATNIAHGDLSQVVTPKSEKDVLGNAVYRMTLYLQQIAQTAKKVAGGNLSERIQLQSEKDFLGNAFAEMILKLRHLVSKIRAGADQLVLLSMETHSRAQEEAESVEKISLSVEETSSSMNEMAATIGGVNESMKQLSSSVGESSSSIEQLNSSIRQIATHGEQLAGASEDTSSSIQEISASLQQIADTAKHSKMLSDGARQDAIYGRESVEKTIQSMNIIQHMIRVTAEAIQLLNRRTESIETILAVIKDISDQTSLLSINASIIAKKAGERGRGFNVIADKVRKLAEQSNSSAKEIARIIRDVRKESSHAVEVVAMGSKKVQEGVKLAELAGKALDKIINGANESSSVVAKIAETTDEQTRISHYVMESMEQVVEMVNQIKVATKEQEQSSTYIMTQTEHVLLLSQQVKRSTSEQTEVVKHVSFAMDEIRTLIQMTSERAKKSTQSASILSQHADALKHLVSQFTI